MVMQIHQHYVLQVMFSMMNVLVMKFLLVLVQAIIINVQNIVLMKVEKLIISIDFFQSNFLVISSDGRLENLNIQSDSDPIRVVKPSDQNIHYKQQVNVRFLEPPPGPEPAPIIIKVNIEFIEN